MRERVAMLSPMPPARTGIAHYASMLAPPLGEAVDLTVVSSPNDPIPDGLRIYQLGNNPHHEWIYNEALRTPGVIVLHDVVLHHLIVEMTLARGDVDGYIAALERNHGAAGAAWARGRAAGLHNELGNFLLPASIEVANRSRAVLVHNRWAADRLLSFGVTTPVHVVPHPYEELPLPVEVPRTKRVIGVFGFLTSAKRADVILEAFRRAEDPSLELLIVGERAPNIDPHIVTTGYVEDLDPWYGRVDRLVNLRYPTAGETSGTLIRAFAAGKPVAVSDYAQFAEYPDDCVTKIPFGDGEVDALVRFFREELDGAAIARAQRAWLETHARMSMTVAGYVHALRAPSALRGAPAHAVLPLFPRLSVIDRTADSITLRNDGDAPLRAREYGAPAYRVLAKLFDADRELVDRWLELPGDLAPGAVTNVKMGFSPFRDGLKPAPTLRLYHALQGVPMLPPEPWYAAAL